MNVSIHNLWASRSHVMHFYMIIFPLQHVSFAKKKVALSHKIIKTILVKYRCLKNKEKVCFGTTPKYLYFITCHLWLSHCSVLVNQHLTPVEPADMVLRSGAERSRGENGIFFFFFNEAPQMKMKWRFFFNFLLRRWALQPAGRRRWPRYTQCWVNFECRGASWVTDAPPLIIPPPLIPFIQQKSWTCHQ